MNAVSCTAANACEAVGEYDYLNKLVPFAEVWNGTAWKLQKVPSPSGSAKSTLNGVSCVAANACEAVGATENSAGQDVALAEGWNGTSWTLQSAVAPVASVLFAVSCTATDFCMAVGADTVNNPSGESMAQWWNGSGWQFMDLGCASPSIGRA